MIYFLGDVHGRFDHVLPAILAQKAAVATVIFLGDIESTQPFEDEIRPLTDAGVGVWFIHGNHDTDNGAKWEHLQSSGHRNLHGRVCEIEGVRVAGLGGVFRGEVWYPDRAAMCNAEPRHRSYDDYIAWLKLKTPPRLHASVKSSRNALKHRSTIFPDTYEELAGQKADILITHDAPSCHPHGFQSIDHLAKAMGVKLVFHGHQHDSLNYQAWEMSYGFRVHGVGFRGITDIQGRRVVAGEFDEARRDRLTKKDENDPSRYFYAGQDLGGTCA